MRTADACDSFILRRRHRVRTNNNIIRRRAVRAVKYTMASITDLPQESHIAGDDVGDLCTWTWV